MLNIYLQNVWGLVHRIPDTRRIVAVRQMTLKKKQDGTELGQA